MRTVPHVSSQFPWCAIWRDTNGDILEVVLPSYNHVVFLSKDTEVCPSVYLNPMRWDHALYDHIQRFIHQKWVDRLTLTTQETGCLKHTTNDLLGVGRKFHADTEAETPAGLISPSNGQLLLRRSVCLVTESKPPS